MDDFGMKYVSEDNSRHLIDSLKLYFTISEDWTAGLYCRIKLKWDYNKLILDIFMPGYIKK